MQANRALVGVVTILGGILACTLPGQVSQEDLAATITAQALTLQAPTATAATPTSTLTSIVQASVTSDTNCRTGPSQAFDRVLVATPGQVFTVVGKNTPTDYWIIRTNTGGTCWLWGRYAVITGDPSTLPEYPAPPEPATSTPQPTKTPSPTPTISKPAAPDGLIYNRGCQAYTEGSIPKWREAVYFSWLDNSQDEQGFGIYVNDVLVETNPKDITTYYTTLTYDQGTGGQLFDKFGVEAYNIAGSSARPAIDVPRCP